MSKRKTLTAVTLFFLAVIFFVGPILFLNSHHSVNKNCDKKDFVRGQCIDTYAVKEKMSSR